MPFALSIRTILYIGQQPLIDNVRRVYPTVASSQNKIIKLVHKVLQFKVRRPETVYSVVRQRLVSVQRS